MYTHKPINTNKHNLSPLPLLLQIRTKIGLSSRIVIFEITGWGDFMYKVKVVQSLEGGRIEQKHMWGSLP